MAFEMRLCTATRAGLVTVDLGLAVPPVTSPMSVLLGRDTGSVDGLGDDRIEIDEFSLLQGVGRLQPREVDDLLGDAGESLALGREALGEALHPFRVLGRLSRASARRPMAPIGVFSSWLMFATKSRRTSSRRYDSVRSSASRSTKRVPSRATRTKT